MPKTRTRPASKLRPWNGWAVVPALREPIEIFSRDFIVEKEAEQWLGNLLESWSIQPATACPDGGGPPRTVVECDHIRKRLNPS